MNKHLFKDLSIDLVLILAGILAIFFFCVSVMPFIPVE
jgi:hypothetical protein